MRRGPLRRPWPAPPRTVELLAAQVRAKTTYNSTEIALLRAARAIRLQKGAFRDRFSVEEIELVARARKIAYMGGQVKLARFLTLRAPGRSSIILAGCGPAHRCPICGRTHQWTPRKRLTKAERAKEVALLEAALKGKTT